MFVKRKYEANNTVKILKKGKANTTKEYNSQ